MPVYGYRCKVCSNSFDLTRPMSDSGKPAECPACGGETKRLFTPTGVHFKGSGFHNTDYKPRAKDDSPSAAAASSGDSAPTACAGCPASSGDACPAASKDSSD